MGPSKWPATFLQHQVWSHQKWVKLIWPPKIGGETLHFFHRVWYPPKNRQFHDPEKKPIGKSMTSLLCDHLEHFEVENMAEGFVGSYRKTFESLTISTKTNACHAAKIQSSCLFSIHLSFWMHFLVDFQHQGQEKYEKQTVSFDHWPYEFSRMWAWSIEQKKTNKQI